VTTNRISSTYNGLRTEIISFQYLSIYSEANVNTFLSIDPCIANIFTEYSQQDATFHNLFISLRSTTCFRLLFPSKIRSSKLYIQSHELFAQIADAVCAVLCYWWWTENPSEHAERLTEIHKLWICASSLLNSANSISLWWLIAVADFFSHTLLLH